MVEKKKNEDIYVRFCPQCKSPDISMDYSNPLQPVDGLPPMYICNKCGHTGNYFPEIKLSELEGFEKEVEKKHLSNTKKDETSLVDTSYGNFTVKVMWKITAPLVLILGLIYLITNTFFGIIISALGIYMIYITYFEKKEIN